MLLIGHTTSSDLDTTTDAAIDTIYGSEFTVEKSCLLSKLSAYIDGQGPSNFPQAAVGIVYDSSDALVATSQETIIEAGQDAGWVDFIFATPPALSAGADYQFGVQFGATDLGARIYTTTDGTNLSTVSNTYLSDWKSTGALSFNYSSTTSGTAATGTFRLNNSTHASATSISLHETDITSTDRGPLINSVLGTPSGGGSTTMPRTSDITITKKSDSSVYRTYTITSAVDNGDDHTLTVTYSAGAGSLTNGDACFVTIRQQEAPFAASYSSGELGIFGTYFYGWTEPNEDDEYFANLAFPTAQQVLGATAPDPRTRKTVMASWHGTLLDPQPQGASLAVVQSNGDLSDIVGDRIKVTVGKNSVIAYIHRETDLDLPDDTQISLSRRVWQELAPLATDSLLVTVEQLGPEDTE